MKLTYDEYDDATHAHADGVELKGAVGGSDDHRGIIATDELELVYQEIGRTRCKGDR